LATVEEQEEVVRPDHESYQAGPRVGLDEIDETYLVTTLDVPALHQSKQIIQTLTSVGYGRERLRLVLNRMPQRLDVTPDELEKMMSLPVFATLPNDYPSLYESYSEGSLLPANSRLGKELNRMAMKVAGIQEEKGGKKKFSLFS
jgi:pilus assembly protein CpaE